MIGAHPLLVLLAVVVVASTAYGVLRFVRRRRALGEALGDARIARRLVGEELGEPPRLRVGLVLGAVVALALALLDPRWGLAPDVEATAGGPVVLVVDVSSSMLARDVPPDRLAAARRGIRELVDALPGRPIGIVAFAGQAVALTPPTVDPGALDLYLDALEPEMATQTGSAVVPAMRQGLALLLSSGAAGGAVVLVTDGDGVDDPDAAARVATAAGRAGIPIFALGVGTARGAPVPDVDFRTGRQVGYKRTAAGEQIVSRLEPGILETVAGESGGAYVELAGPESVSRLAGELDRARSGRAGEGAPESSRPRYPWFAALALVLLAAEGLARRRPTAGAA